MQTASKLLIENIVRTIFTALINSDDESERGVIVGNCFDLMEKLTPSPNFLLENPLILQFLKTSLKALIYEGDELTRSVIVGCYYDVVSLVGNNG